MFRYWATVRRRALPFFRAGRERAASRARSSHTTILWRSGPSGCGAPAGGIVSSAIFVRTVSQSRRLRSSKAASRSSRRTPDIRVASLWQPTQFACRKGCACRSNDVSSLAGGLSAASPPGRWPSQATAVRTSHATVPATRQRFRTLPKVIACPAEVPTERPAPIRSRGNPRASWGHGTSPYGRSRVAVGPIAGAPKDPGRGIALRRHMFPAGFLLEHMGGEGNGQSSEEIPGARSFPPNCRSDRNCGVRNCRRRSDSASAWLQGGLARVAAGTCPPTGAPQSRECRSTCFRIGLVRRPGLEPGTHGLKGRCSTN